MKPADLSVEQFASYPPLARQMAVEHLPLLQQLPISFIPFLLKETITLDWKFPAERDELLAQLRYLESLSAADRTGEMKPFAELRLSPELEAFNAVNLPGQFLERLSAHLWATSQMDTFRSASEMYMARFRSAYADPAPAIPRLAVVFIGRGVTTNNYPLFRKLRREGCCFRRVDGAGGVQTASELLASRVALQPAPYAHWLIDGAQPFANSPKIACVSYEALASVRFALTAKMRQAFESRTSPELLRTALAEMTPESLGMKDAGQDEVLNRFKVSLLTEGSGTQIYSTTFVQWTAREALRRAKPLTLVARFAPRVREASMNELLNGNVDHATDPAGSLVDADMGAWYTWISLQRLTGADQSSFIAWFEDGNQAVAVGPSFPKSKEDNSPVSLAALLKRAG